DLKRKVDYFQTTYHPFKRSAQLFMLAFFAFLAYMALIRKKIAGSDNDGADSDSRPGLVDGRAEEYSRKEAPSASPVATALQSLQPGLAMAGAGDAAATPGFAAGGSFSPAAGFDHTGASHYGDPMATAA